MKKRILTGWTFARALYLLMGVYVIIQSGLSHQWLGVVLGGYFASMGLFAFGCASGNCIGGNCTVNPSDTSKTNTKELAEVKAK